MTRPELLEKVLAGWFAIVGEFRGWNASSMGHLDRKTGLASIRVFEMHKRHGLHVHMVTNERIDVVQARALAEKAGWGRIHVTVMPAEHARYLAKYLSKDRPRLPQALEALGGVWGRLGANEGEGPDKGVPFQHGLSGLQGMAGMDRTG